MTQRNKYLNAFIAVTSLFFMWGLITVLVDSLIPRLKEIFELNNFQAALVQFAFFTAYGLVSIPAGKFLSKIGYKKGMLVGLATMGVGCLMFWPAASLRIFPVFMLGYFILASGMTVLQVAANPYVSVLGPEESASSRLNLSQAFNSLGTAIAPIIGANFILSDSILSSDQIGQLVESDRLNYFAQEASAVSGPFIVLAMCLLGLAGVVAFFKLPQVLGSQPGGGYFDVIKNNKLMLGALGIFLYVGAEVAIGSFLVNYFVDMGMPDIVRENGFMASVADKLLKDPLGQVDNKGIVGAFVLFYWSGAMVGRFIGSVIMKFISAKKLLAIFGLLAISMVLISMATTGLISMWSILAVGLFNSIMFPTIFTIGIEDLGDQKPLGSGILCTAICGGAFIPLAYGALADGIGYKMAFIMPILCYLYIAYYGFKYSNQKAIVS